MRKCSWEQSVASCLRPRTQVAAKSRCECLPAGGKAARTNPTWRSPRWGIARASRLLTRGSRRLATPPCRQALGEGGEGCRPRGEGPPGREGTPRPQAADSPARVARLAARGGGMRAGPRGARRRLRPACAPAAWLPAWPSRAGASAPLAGRGNSRADGKCIPRVHAEGAFWHPGTRGGAARQKLRRACTRGARFLASGRWRWGSLSETPWRVHTRDEASDAGPSRGGVPPVERQSES